MRIIFNRFFPLGVYRISTSVYTVVKGIETWLQFYRWNTVMPCWPSPLLLGVSLFLSFYSVILILSCPFSWPSNWSGSDRIRIHTILLPSFSPFLCHINVTRIYRYKNTEHGLAVFRKSLTINVPVLYLTKDFDAGKSISKATGRGRPKKSRDFQGPPLPVARVMDLLL